MFRDKLTSAFDWLLNLLPYLSIAAALITIVFLLATGNAILLSKASLVLAAVIIVSVLLIINKKTIQTRLDFSKAKELLLNIPANHLNKVYLIVFFAAIAVALAAQEFTTPFLILIVVLYGITILQIFSHHKGSTAIILELLATTTLLAIIKVSSYGFLYGTNDVIYHVIHTNIILSAETIPPGFGSYQQYPGIHLLAAGTSLLTGLSTYLSGIITQIAFVFAGGIFVYYLAQTISHKKFIAEIAILFYFLLPGTLFAAINFYPSMQAGMCCIIFFYLFIHGDTTMPKSAQGILLIITLLHLVIVHHATAILMVGLFALLLISFWIYKKKLSVTQIIVSSVFYAVVLIKLVSSYLPSAINILRTYLFDSISSGEAAKITFSTNALEKLELTYIINSAISIFIILFVYLTIYYLISKKKNYNCGDVKVLLPIIVIFFIFMLPGVASSLPLLSTVASTFANRFYYYFIPFFAIAMGIGCLVLLCLAGYKLRSKKAPAVICIILCLLCVFTGPLVLHGAGTYSILGEDIYSPSKNYFTAGEVASLITATEIIPSKSLIAEDAISLRWLTETKNMENYGVKELNGDTGALKDMLSVRLDKNSIPYVFFRNEEYLHYGLSIIAKAKNGVTISYSDESNNLFRYNTRNYNTVYENGASILYAL